MRDGMRVLSLFSGLGAFDLGLELAGMEIVGQVEIDPTCLRVLEHHWPDVRRWTDVRGLSFHDERCGLGVKSLQVCTCELADVGEPVAVGAEQDTVGNRVLAAVGAHDDVMGVNGSLVPAAIHAAVPEPAAHRLSPTMLVCIRAPLVDDVGLAAVPAPVKARSVVCPLCGGVSSDEPILDARSASTLACVHGKDYIAFSINRPDIVCGGVPCQPFSVAGQRRGETDERNLWPDFFRIVREVRPRWVVAENVPGILSVHGGRFFGEVLDRLGELGFKGVSYAILDSQHFGVPQRRRRVFVVCGPTSRSTEQVLSLCESCGGHPPAGRTEREAVAATIRGRAHGPSSNEPGRGGEDDTNLVVANSLNGNAGRRQIEETYIPELVGTLSDGAHMGGGLNGQDAYTGRIISVRTAQTYTLDGTEGQAVAFAQNTRDEVRLLGGNIAGALAAQPGMKQQTYIADAAVRRLTPTECLRLQGLPDDWLELGSDQLFGNIEPCLVNMIRQHAPDAEWRVATDLLWTEREASASCTTRESSDTEAWIILSADSMPRSRNAHVVSVSLGVMEPEDIAAVITSHGKSTAILYKLNVNEKNGIVSELVIRRDGQNTGISLEKVIAESGTGSLLKICSDDHLSEAKLSTISTWIGQTTARKICTSIRPTQRTLSVMLLSTASSKPSSDEASFTFKTGRTTYLSDGPKYRMVGNAVTVPVVEYLGRRILETDRCR